MDPAAAAPSRVGAGTIVSGNYLAYAKVLADSIRANFSEAEFRVLVVDRKCDGIAQAAAALELSIVWAEDLGIPDFEQIAYKFDILELNTALKPTFLKHLIALGNDAVIYWDPDIRLYSRPTPILGALATSSVVLTPHALHPLMDGHRPSDIDLMRHGAYNLGFIAIKADTTGQALLDWWEDRCLGHGFCDLIEGVFVDQKWMDLAPGYFDGVEILKHPGCNVAYWNLHERTLTWVDGQAFAGAKPLVFFHFSGVDPHNPSKLSKYQNRHDIRSGHRESIAQLVSSYCGALLAAGHERLAGTAYSFGVLSNGIPINAVMRRALVCAGHGEQRPFDAGSAFQRRLERQGLWDDGRVGKPAQINALNVDLGDRRLRLANAIVRTGFRLLGRTRIELILKYLVFLARGSNMAAVLTRCEFALDHRPRQPHAASDLPEPR